MKHEKCRMKYREPIIKKNLIHLGQWYEKNKKMKENNKSPRRKVIILKYKISMKKLRMAVTKKKEKKTHLDVFGQVSQEV